jgi:hypothetical protein
MDRQCIRPSCRLPGSLAGRIGKEPGRCVGLRAPWPASALRRSCAGLSRKRASDMPCGGVSRRHKAGLLCPSARIATLCPTSSSIRCNAAAGVLRAVGEIAARWNWLEHQLGVLIREGLRAGQERGPRIAWRDGPEAQKPRIAHHGSALARGSRVALSSRRAG